MEKNDITKTIESDTLQYKKNKLPAMLALLGLVFNCLYFCLLYGVKDDTGNTRWSQIDIGISVILTLVLLLVTFLSSEGVKGYNKKFCIPLLVIAVFQIARIFYFPLYGLQNNILTIPYFWIYPKSSEFEFIMMVIWLVASAGCLIASAVLGYLQTMRLEKHLKAVADGKIDMQAVFATAQAEEESAKAAEVVSEDKAEVEQTEEKPEASSDDNSEVE